MGTMARLALTRPLVLSGFMATGKGTIGRILADRLGVPFLDTDALLVAETGKAVSDLFTSEGEARFRDREAALVLPMLADPTPRVIAFGGGTATIPRVRHAAPVRVQIQHQQGDHRRHQRPAERIQPDRQQRPAGVRHPQCVCGQIGERHRQVGGHRRFSYTAFA